MDPINFSRGQQTNSLRGVRLAYHAPVFDSTGYGNAARAYIRSLHEAGADIAVQELSTFRNRPVRCSLMNSLLAPADNVDFHVFHGVPAIWARAASGLRNVIAITVWETETMPAEWQGPLSSAIDVWVPSRFNQATFRDALGRQPFCLPHPLVGRDGDWGREECNRFLRVSEDEFVIYAIFEWQDRKCPEHVIRAYLLAFDASDRAALLIKTNPDADEDAHRTLARLRAETGSEARVEIRCEAWDEPEIAALHLRGDCYLSLHRGEGWCYPLFEAACAGKAVVATGYSGPLDYLDPSVHFLVRHCPSPVRQEYRFYHPDMRWAEPDCGHAAECLRSVYEHRDALRAKTSEVAARLRLKYSLENVGHAACQRLLHLAGGTRETGA